MSHRHDPEECRTAYAAWSGYDSPLRRKPAIASCPSGGHSIFWVIDAPDRQAALAQLPEWLASRTAVSEVTEVPIP